MLYRLTYLFNGIKNFSGSYEDVTALISNENIQVLRLELVQ